MRQSALGQSITEDSVPTDSIVTPEASEFENVIGTAMMQLTKRLEYGVRIKVCSMSAEQL
jgi:uncharacterized protein YlaN (UPF0358 family)